MAEVPKASEAMGGIKPQALSGCPFQEKQSIPPMKTDDPVWTSLRAEVAEQVAKEPVLASFLHATVLNHRSLHDSLSFHLASRLANASLPCMLLREVIEEAMNSDPTIGAAVRADLRAVVERDPAARGFGQPFLFFKGFHVIQTHRIIHWLWNQGRNTLAFYLQSRVSELWSVDIHPAARLGQGLLMDHATGVVIGETAVVEDDVSLFHEVTLGGTGKETGDRHPKIRKGVLIGAGAKIIGNIEVGEGAKVAAGSVVLKSVPAHTTVAGVPAKVVRRAMIHTPALQMDQCV
jgi:serine O-acetyltransferase